MRFKIRIFEFKHLKSFFNFGLDIKTDVNYYEDLIFCQFKINIEKNRVEELFF